MKKTRDLDISGLRGRDSHNGALPCPLGGLGPMAWAPAMSFRSPRNQDSAGCRPTACSHATHQGGQKHPAQNATGSATLLWQAWYEPPNSQTECRITPGRPEPSRSALGPGVGCLNDERKLVHQGWHTLHLPSMPVLFTVGTPRKLSAQNSPATILEATRGNSQTSTFHSSTASTPVNNSWSEPKSAL